MIKIKRVHKPDLQQYWGDVEKFLDTVNEKTQATERYSNDYYLGQLLSQAKQLWVALDGDRVHAIGITSLHQLENKRWCLLEVVASDETKPMEWADLIAYLENWAQHKECCDRFYIEGRLGWQRVMKPAGYEPVSLTLGKKL
jgi:hypothetical protein